MNGRTGIYGLFNLDGAPLEPSDAAILALPVDLDARACASVHAVDLADPGAVQTDRTGDAVTVLLGRMGDVAALAARLGMDARTPGATLAREALRRFGPDIRHIVAGEWTLLHQEQGCVTLASSLAMRDRLLYAHKGTRLALGPDLRQLSRLSWVCGDLDDTGLLFALGRQDLRAAMGDRTVLADVRALDPGGHVSFRTSHRRAAPRALPARAPSWRGGFEDAMEQGQALLEQSVREQMWSDRIGCLLSGGLDSSTLAWLVARNRQPQTTIRCLTSTAPPGSGLADETPAAGIVASHLGLPMDPIVPDEPASAYRPTTALLRESNGPALGPRHYLYDAFAAHSTALRIPLLFDGQFGEYTFTYPFALWSLRERARDAVRRLRAYREGIGTPAPEQHFHVFIPRQRLTAAPGPVAAALAAPPNPARPPARGKPWGMLPGFQKILAAPASLALGAVRIAQPFRDPRLLTFFSGLPANLLQRRGQDRVPVRHILTGQLPDTIRLQAKGLPISPDYEARLIRQAPEARSRIGRFRRAGIDEWLDLDDLDAALAQIAAGRACDQNQLFKAQLTAMTAEFILWWRDPS